MAITAVLRAEDNSTANASSYTDVESTTPGANKGLLMTVWQRGSSPAAPTSIAYAGLTWTKRKEVADGTQARLSLWTAYSGSSPSASQYVITMPAGNTGCISFLIEFDGVDMTDFLVQSVSNVGASGTTATVTLAALADGTNNAEIMVTGNSVGSAFTPDATGGWTELADRNNGSPLTASHFQWRIGTDLTCTSTWTGSVAWAAIAAEIKAASTGPTGSGGGDSAVSVVAVGDGIRLEKGTGGGISTVTTTALGGGTPLEKGTGGGDAAVQVVATGGGSAGVPPTGSGGGVAPVTVTATGGGKEGHSGGGTATVTATAAGGGMWGHTSGGVATVTVTGQGGGKEGHASGGVAGITVTATGEGSGPAPSGSGGSDSPVLVSATGGGTAFVPAGGGSAAVLVAATGGGEGEVGIFTGPWVGTLGVRVDTATVLVEET